jgi:magnesium chelatase family protein
LGEYSETKEISVSNPQVLLIEHPVNETKEKSLKIAVTPKSLIGKSYTLKGGILAKNVGLIIDIKSVALELKRSVPIDEATEITGSTKGAAMKEVLKRIGGAFTKYGIPKAKVGIKISLEPADISKEGTWLDLPIAIIMLQTAGIISACTDDYILIGEVSQHGDIRRVPGILSIMERCSGQQKIIVPEENRNEASLLKFYPNSEHCLIHPVKTLEEVIKYFQPEHHSTLDSITQDDVNIASFIPVKDDYVDFGKIRGKEAKQAALICAAGGHNLLMFGPKGTGKSEIAKAIPSILPNLTKAEIAKLTSLYSAHGKLEHDVMAVTRRPVRQVSSAISKSALIGGGSGDPKPGEITLAHLGILFMDEFPEFDRDVLEALRQPMQDRYILISRGMITQKFPTNFTLVAAMNLCPCGNYPNRNCCCASSKRKAYQQRISGPILDRIDLQVELKELTTEEFFAQVEPEQTPKFQSIVQQARNRQIQRFSETTIPFNAAMPGTEIGKDSQYCNFSSAGWEHYHSTVTKERMMSNRARHGLAKVARTVADISDSETIEPSHIDEAAFFVIGGRLRDIMAN